MQHKTTMIRLALVVLLSSVIYSASVQGLECDITEHIEDDNIQIVLRRCAGLRVGDLEEKQEKTTTASPGSSDEDHHSYSARRGISSKSKRSYKIVKRETVTTPPIVEDHREVENKTDTSQECFLQCIFTELEMVDSNGFPDHHRVAQELLKYAKGRELRDFIQDSTDSCFQTIEQGEKLNSCEYTTHLFSCLSEKGRSNCADWQVMKLPFHN